MGSTQQSSGNSKRKRRAAKHKQCKKCLRWFLGTGHGKHEKTCDGEVKEGKGLTTEEYNALSAAQSMDNGGTSSDSDIDDDASSPPANKPPLKRKAAVDQPQPTCFKVLVTLEVPPRSGKLAETHVVTALLSSGKPSLSTLLAAILPKVSTETHNIQRLSTMVQRKPVIMADDEQLADRLAALRAGQMLEVVVPLLPSALQAAGSKPKKVQKTAQDIADTEIATDQTLGKTQGLGALRNKFRPTNRQNSASAIWKNCRRHWSLLSLGRSWQPLLAGAMMHNTRRFVCDSSFA